MSYYDIQPRDLVYNQKSGMYEHLISTLRRPKLLETRATSRMLSLDRLDVRRRQIDRCCCTNQSPIKRNL